MRLAWWLSLCLAAAPVFAQATAAVDPVDDDIRDLDAVVVTGVQPGPALWKVRHGEHTLHILGIVSPLPKGMEWRSAEVTSVLDEAGVVLGQPGVVFGADIGMLRGLTLLPSAMRARNNPGGATLEDVVPPADHARWRALKARYIGRDRGIERRRPMIAAFELYEKAVERAGLSGRGVVWPVIESALDRRKIEATSTMLSLSVDDPRAALAEYRKEALTAEELDCFGKMLDLVERELPRMVERANAWAVGDTDTLRAMRYEGQYEACRAAWSSSEAVRKRGLTDIDARVRARWLEAAEAALREQRVSLAVVPVSTLLAEDGLLAALSAKGYQVESP